MATNVRRFIWLWWTAILLALVDILLLPAPSLSELRLGMTRSIQMGVYGSVAAIWLATQLPFLWLAVRRRKNWARWLLLVIFVAENAFSVAFVFVHPTPPPGVDPSWLHPTWSLVVVGWVSLATEAAAFYFLFTGDAGAWFRGESASV
jgi:hypothetical protein